MPPEIFFSRGEKDESGKIIIKLLPMSELRTLDNADLEYCDLKVNVREWSKGPNKGKSVYLDSGVFIAKRNPMIEQYNIQD